MGFHTEDASLHRHGRNLRNVAPAAEEVADRYRAAEEAEDAARKLREQAEEAGTTFREVMGKMTTQSETELPTEQRLRASTSDVHQGAMGATTSDDWRRVAAEASSLPLEYEVAHYADEDRLSGRRGDERRSDVSYAGNDV